MANDDEALKDIKKLTLDGNFEIWENRLKSHLKV